MKTGNSEFGIRNSESDCSQQVSPVPSLDDSGRGRTRARALKILGSRLMSAREMEKRLVEKGEPEEAAKETVKWLEDIGAINDASYAGSIVSHYSAKGYGDARIKDELYKRGIPREMWDDALSSIEESEADEAALRYLEKRLRGSTDKEDLRRVTNALCRRGFSYEEAGAAVKKYIQSVEEE